VRTAGAADDIDELFGSAAAAGVDERVLAGFLRGARAALEARREHIELVWTGPNAPTVAIYRTDRTLLDVIASARRHLLVVTFTAYDVDAIREALRAALIRGVHVDLVLELAKADGGKVSFSPLGALAPANHDRLGLWVWPPEDRPTAPDGRYGTLHAKCAVADGRTLLVSSANLTGDALELNMELGVLVTGGDAPGRVRDHFLELIRRGVLVAPSG
jgi:phosphatidylserine/phosphatidylglycerophosphate/cardiolipin synthase-like enzyme